MEKFTANTIYITETSKATGTDSSITREQEAKTRRNDESCLTASRSLGPRNSFPALSRCSVPISATVGGPLDGRTRDKVEGQANVTENEMIKGTSAYQIVLRLHSSFPVPFFRMLAAKLPCRPEIESLFWRIQPALEERPKDTVL